MSGQPGCVRMTLQVDELLYLLVEPDRSTEEQRALGLAVCFVRRVSVRARLASQALLCGHCRSLRKHCRARFPLHWRVREVMNGRSPVG